MMSQTDSLRAGLLALSILPILRFPTPIPAAQQQELEVFSGRWLCEKPRPARVELERFVLELSVAEGEVAGHLELASLKVPLEGSIEERGSLARFSASAQGRTVRFELRRNGPALVGRVDQWGQVSDMRAQRATPELEDVPPFSELTEIEVEFPIEIPQRVFRAGLGEEQARAVDEEILALMVSERIVGLTAAVVRDGEVIDIRSFGWQDYHAEIPASEETMYRWASVSKPLTALSALMLADEDRLDLHEDVRKQVPEWPEWPDQRGAITPILLLTHQSGIAGDDDLQPRSLSFCSPEHPWANRIAALDMFSESGPVFAPGEGFQYTTPGYVLLGAVVERAAGMPFSQYVQEHICKPLGMSTMRPDRTRDAIEHRAAGYGQMNSDSGVFQQNVDDIRWKLPAGGWISTAEDLGRFVAGLMGPDLVSAGTQETMWTARSTANGTPTSFGLGVIVQSFGEQLSVSHSGSQLLTSTHFICLPEEQLGVVLMCNKEGVVLTGLGQRILSACR